MTGRPEDASKNEYIVETQTGNSYKVTTTDHHDNHSWARNVADALHRVVSNQEVKDVSAGAGIVSSIYGVGRIASDVIGSAKKENVNEILREILNEIRKRPL